MRAWQVVGLPSESVHSAGQAMATRPGGLTIAEAYDENSGSIRIADKSVLGVALSLARLKIAPVVLKLGRLGLNGPLR